MDRSAKPDEPRRPAACLTVCPTADFRAVSRPRQAGQVWQVGHQNTLRSRRRVGAQRPLADGRAAPPARPAARAGTPTSRDPGGSSPVKVRPERSRLARIMRAPRSTSAGGIRPRSRDVVGRMPRTNRISFAYSLPKPATLRWSSRATCDGPRSAPRRRAASAGSQSSLSGSGPRWPDELLLVAGGHDLDHRRGRNRPRPTRRCRRSRAP